MYLCRLLVIIRTVNRYRFMVAKYRLLVHATAQIKPIEIHTTLAEPKIVSVFDAAPATGQ